MKKNTNRNGFGVVETLVGLVAIAGLIGIVMLMFMQRVPAGYVGVKVNLLGGDKGVDVQPVGPGRHFVGWNQELHKFPTFTQTTEWTADSRSGSEGDESVTFQTAEGMKINADIGLTYSIDPTRAAELFQRYRKGIDEITDQYLRNYVRDALNAVCSTKKVEDAYGVGKEQIIKEVEARVRDQVATYGINVERIFPLSDFRLPSDVVARLNEKIQRIQQAEAKEYQVREAIAEANFQRETAKGIADSKLIQAEGEARALDIIGKALAANPTLIQYESVKKWDGVLPQVSSGAGMIMQLPQLNSNK